MPLELYETLYMLDANKMATEADTIRGQLHTMLEKHGAQILVSRTWDENRKLSYPIRRASTTHKKAHFHIIYYKLESGNQVALDADIRLTFTDFVIRYMTSIVDPKWSEAMMEVATKETSAAFALRGMQDDSPPTEINPPHGGAPVDGVPPEGAPPASGGRRRRSEASEKPE